MVFNIIGILSSLEGKKRGRVLRYYIILYLLKMELSKFLKSNIVKNINPTDGPILIDFSKNESITDYIKKQDRLDKFNKENLEYNMDAAFKPHRNTNDTPEMTLFKDALELKHIDLDAYIPSIQSATGSNFNNDKKLLDKTEMTIKKMKGFADGLDMKMTLTIEDRDGNIPNPIGKPISIVINSGHGGYN